MSKNEQVLLLEPPNELRFRGPFTDVVTANLTLTNPTMSRVCFKVKTTAPKRYCVRPNSGLLEPGKAVSVAVMLQPFDYDPNEKNKHKFMVQTMIAPDGKIENQEALWKDAPAEKLMDSKLKCVFEMPVDMNNANNEEITKQVISDRQTLPKANPADPVGEYRKLAEECKRLQSEKSQLREENSQLRTDNNKMKEETVRLRKVAVSDTVSSTPASSALSVKSASPISNIPPIVLAIVALILGLILGKVLL
ncbi:vesicle-associated membrane protein/synaptobrevin-binding protein-like [Liolophura sinensis]|uniref:vesicle-associated membrane protein/synaptobrevin-binding protein-like n=1 Tax=Liolophura sinensis TaxID=3198878 RepID=UPI003159624C